MDEPMTLNHSHGLGYEFSSSSYSKNTGYFRADIILRPNPTHKHFDPERVFFVISDHESIERLIISYTTGPQFNKYRVVAGLIRIQDRKGKVVFAFTFGGELQIVEEEQKKICTLISTAPILQFLQPTVVRFIEDVEILLAKRRAYWGSNPNEFETRLAAVEPLVLYVACLEYLIEKYKDPILEISLSLKHYLQAEHYTLHKEHKLPHYSMPLRELI